jgi:NAD-dependent dihydropyrimidine dehydrogenase PreA subunit
MQGRWMIPAPVNAIGKQGSKRVINPDTCIDCGACEAVCPARAIHLCDLPDVIGELIHSTRKI